MAENDRKNDNPHRKTEKDKNDNPYEGKSKTISEEVLKCLTTEEILGTSEEPLMKKKIEKQ
jgi:hypothetical protein